MIELTSPEKELVATAERLEMTNVVEEIIKISNISWDHPLSYEGINNWLSNFDGSALGSEKAEKNLALWLLSGFIHFSLDDVRGYCQCLFSEFIHTKLTEYKKAHLFQELTLDQQVEHILDSSVFLSLGNDSESGSNILYYFRQINKLDKKVFEKDLKEKYENLVFVDDVTISGIQALTYIPRISGSISADKMYFLTFLASDTAIDELSYLNVQVLYGNRLTDRERCFSGNSYVFSSESKQAYLLIAKKMCEYYGNIITQGHPEVDGFPLGVDEAQGLFCFFYNTPDNTLPVFWCSENNWKPIFKRFEKVTKGEVLISDSRYV